MRERKDEQHQNAGNFEHEKLTIGAIKNEHFAGATIVSGNVLANDIVEFEPKS